MPVGEVYVHYVRKVERKDRTEAKNLIKVSDYCASNS